MNNQTYNIYGRKKGTKRFKAIGNFDWFTHDSPYQSAVKWVKEQKTKQPTMEFEIRDLKGDVINSGRPKKYKEGSKVVSARLNKNHIKVLEVFGKGIPGEGVIWLIEETNLYKKLISAEKDEREKHGN